MSRVDKGSEVISVIQRGAVIAGLIPASPQFDRDAIKRIWEEEDRLAAEIARHWPAGVSAADAIAEDRE